MAPPSTRRPILLPRTDDSNALSTLPIAMITLLTIAIFSLIIYYTCIKDSPSVPHDNTHPASSWYHTSSWVRSIHDNSSHNDFTSSAPFKRKARRKHRQSKRHIQQDIELEYSSTNTTTKSSPRRSHQSTTTRSSPTKKSRLPRTVSVRGSTARNLSQSARSSTISNSSFGNTSVTDEDMDDGWSKRLSTISEESRSARESPRKEWFKNLKRESPVKTQSSPAKKDENMMSGKDGRSPRKNGGGKEKVTIRQV